MTGVENQNGRPDPQGYEAERASGYRFLQETRRWELLIQEGVVVLQEKTKVAPVFSSRRGGEGYSRAINLALGIKKERVEY